VSSSTSVSLFCAGDCGNWAGWNGTAKSGAASATAGRSSKAVRILEDELGRVDLAQMRGMRRGARNVFR
jgi:hypothetical protein